MDHYTVVFVDGGSEVHEVVGVGEEVFTGIEEWRSIVV